MIAFWKPNVWKQLLLVFLLHLLPVRSFTSSSSPSLNSLHVHTRDTTSRSAANIKHSNTSQLHAEKDPEQRGPNILRAEAESLKAQAEKLRLEIEGTTNSVVAGDNSEVPETVASSPWAIVSEGLKEDGDQDYRLYVDIGREPGTWMEPRWGASGKRIEFTLDVRLLTNRLATPEVSKKMVKDNSMGKSSQVFALETANFARLRDGFDKMKCNGGAYRIDTGRSGRRTIRMFINVEGTNKADQSYVYGDISVPSGCLYFSLPCYGNGINNLSIKEGLVSVRQIGWHTGWRREESRICGVFKAKLVSEAQQKDGY